VVLVDEGDFEVFGCPLRDSCDAAKQLEIGAKRDVRLRPLERLDARATALSTQDRWTSSTNALPKSARRGASLFTR
jgi:hypothetical protein